MTRFRFLAILCLLAAPALGAQAPADSARAPRGAATTVIGRAEIAASGARTLSELLLARVPGLSVRPRSGAEAEGAEVHARGMLAAGPLGSRAGPLLVIDGSVADGRQSLAVPGTTVTVSRLDDLLPADIERIEVMRGPAASALYGLGAAPGVIVITTRRGGAGSLALDVAAGAGLTDLDAEFPTNYQLVDPATGRACSAQLYNTPPSGCESAQLISWNPLAQASPFRTGRTTTGRAALSGTLLGTRLFLGAGTDRSGGITSDDWQRRLGLRASVERALPGRLTMSAQGGWLTRDASVPARGNYVSRENVFWRGLLGAARDDSLRGYYSTAFMQRVQVTIPEPDLVRTTGSLRLDWRPARWLTVNALGGRDRDRSSAARFMVDPLTNGPVETFLIGHDQSTSGTVQLGAEARYGVGRRLSMATRVAYDDVRWHVVGSDSSGDRTRLFMNFLTVTWWDRTLTTRDATVRQHVAWGEALHINAGTRSAVGRGVSAPFGRDAARNVDVSWRVPGAPAALDLRLRGAAGIAPLEPAGSYVAELTFDCFSRGANCSRLLRSRRAEHEVGLDLAAGPRAQVRATWYDARTRDMLVGMNPGSPAVQIAWPATADLRDQGLELEGAIRVLEQRGLAWHTTVTASTLRNRIERIQFENRSNTGLLRVGYPNQGIWSRGYWFADDDGDGVLLRTEVHQDTTWRYVGPSRPTLEVGLRNTVSLGGLRLDALLDHRGGHYRVNQTEAARCNASGARCRAMHDASLPIAERALALATWQAGTPLIEPASFVRLREVVLEWSVPARATRLLGADRLALRVVGQSLATWTRYSGLDPEVGTESTGGAWAPPMDLFGAPLTRRVMVEIRVGAGLGR